MFLLWVVIGHVTFNFLLIGYCDFFSFPIMTLNQKWALFLFYWFRCHIWAVAYLTKIVNDFRCFEVTLQWNVKCFRFPFNIDFHNLLEHFALMFDQYFEWSFLPLCGMKLIKKEKNTWKWNVYQESHKISQFLWLDRKNSAVWWLVFIKNRDLKSAFPVERTFPVVYQVFNEMTLILSPV